MAASDQFLEETGEREKEKALRDFPSQMGLDRFENGVRSFGETALNLHFSRDKEDEKPPIYKGGRKKGSKNALLREEIL